MFSILFISYWIVTINSFSVDIIDKDFNDSIEKILLINSNLFVGSLNSLHRLSSSTLNTSLPPYKLGPQLQTSSTCTECQTNNYLKILLPIEQNRLLLCGTLNQGACQIIDDNFNLIINSSVPVVANDPVNSTIGLIIPERNLIYFGVTYTNEGAYRWQIPNLSGRSLNLTNFMKILSTNDDETISRDDLSLRFMPRQQTTFIVQYIFAFSTKNYIYFLTNQPNDIDQSSFLTKIVRFCRDSSYSIIRTYTEIPLICLSSDWIIKTAELIRDRNDQQILIGHFTRKDGSGGTNICSWNVRYDIDKAFEDNYRTCYSMGIGQRGLAFIKPNEVCRKDESWAGPINDDDLCPWINNDRLVYPVGGTTPVIGLLLYDSTPESSSAFRMYSFGSSYLVVQGLTNGTFKLGLFKFERNINWFYSSQLSAHSAILSNIIFDQNNATLFLASGSKIYRISFSADCTSRSSCDECLSSSNNPLCGWCTMNQRCTLASDCSSKSWQRESNQCTHIVNVQPLKASVDNSQWINLTFSKLPQLEHNEIYQCIFADRTMSANTQAIKLDHNRLSCPTPSRNIPMPNGSSSIVRLTVIKWPSNTSIATVPEFTFYNCSSYSSCLSCRSQSGCQWCSQKCSSMCTESLSQCPSFSLLNLADRYLQSDHPLTIPLKFESLQSDSPIECRLNETIRGLVNSDRVCSISKIPEAIQQNDQVVTLTIDQNDVRIGLPIEMFLYRCDLYDSCNQCNRRSQCSWCEGRCLSKLTQKCSTDEQCTSLRIAGFTPKYIPLAGNTVVTIDLNEDFKETILEVLLANVPCSIMNASKTIQCRSQPTGSSRKGQISIRFSNSIYILSKEEIEYRQPSITSIKPSTVFEFGGQTLHINGQNLFLGNEQQIFIGNYQCIPIEQTFETMFSCRLPSMMSGIYNITLKIDNQPVNTEQKLTVTPNPLVQDIDPTISFASGGRLITVRGMYFGSAQTITVKFAHRKWNAKLKINPHEIVSREDDILSSFHFRTPGIPPPSIDFPSPPFDVNFSLYFDNTIIALPNLIQFHYIPDVLLNISSTPPTLPYTGEELKLQVDNLTEAASIADIQLLIGCSECKLKTFTSKGITCQPPSKLLIKTAIILNNQQREDDCSLFNSSVGPIRFRIGYREYVIGYLSYTRALSSKHSILTIVSLIAAGCLLVIALFTLSLYLVWKFRKIRSSKTSLSTKTTTDQSEKQLWSTDISASTGPYYQVYEQISSLSSRDNTLTRAPLLLCPYYQEKRSTPPIMEQLQMSLAFLTTISIEDNQLKKLLFPTEIQSNDLRHSMELFYDLLNMKPFSQAFIDQLILMNCKNDLIQSYVYLFRYTPENLQSFPLTRENSFSKFFATLFLQPKTNLINQFHFFDDFLRILIDSIDSAPCDEILHRSSRSISSSTLLLSNIQYNSFQLTIDYENFFRFHIPVLDCDTVNQVKQKILRYFNSYEKTYRLIEYEQLDLILPPLNICPCIQQTPMLKNYLLNSTIYCQKNNQLKTKDNNHFLYHLSRESSSIDEANFLADKLIENKTRLEQILLYFYSQIANGLDLFATWSKQYSHENNQVLFQKYIQLVSDLIRRLNRLMLCRSNCPIIESCLNVIADGLEFLFETKTEFSSEIEMLFSKNRKHFSSLDQSHFHLNSSTHLNSSPSSADIRSLILADDRAIECLFKLYQFYELHSEPINQHIGENHVSVLLPVHHLLVQIRQLLQSDNTTLI